MGVGVALGWFSRLTSVFVILSSVQVALQNKIKLPDCLNFIKEARAQGLTIPVVLMGAWGRRKCVSTHVHPSIPPTQTHTPLSPPTP